MEWNYTTITSGFSKKPTYLRFNIITNIIMQKLKIHSKPRNLPVILTYLPEFQYYNQYYQEKVINS